MKEHRKVLVLNADFLPLHLMPLSTISWQEALILIYQQKATAIDYYDDTIRSASGEEHRLPSVLVLKNYKFFKHKAKYSKYNVKLRDGFRCQYCGERHSHRSLTVDHVLPRSKGGKTGWNNIVAACKPCNQAKKNNEKVVPKKKPKTPTYYELAKKLLAEERITNEHWQQYVEAMK